MKVVVYEFDVYNDKFTREDVESFDEQRCEEFYKNNQYMYAVHKHVGEIQDMLNESELDIDNKWYRVFAYKEPTKKIFVDGIEYASKEKAEKFFLDAMLACEGSEGNRMSFAYGMIVRGYTRINTYNETARR